MYHLKLVYQRKLCYGLPQVSENFSEISKFGNNFFLKMG